MRSAVNLMCLRRRPRKSREGSMKRNGPARRTKTLRFKFGGLVGAADDVELHEIGGAADAHGRAGDDADDVALAHEAFFEQALFGDFSEAVDFADIGDAARTNSPDESEAAACFHFR